MKKSELKRIIKEEILKLNEASNIDTIKAKDINNVEITYTDYGRLYSTMIFLKKANAKRIRMTNDEANDFLKKQGINIKIPRNYDYDILDKIVAKLKQKNIKCTYNDAFDVS